MEYVVVRMTLAGCRMSGIFLPALYPQWAFAVFVLEVENEE